MRFLKLIPMSILSIGISQTAHAQDMSGWSDKTICRLLNTQKDIEPYMEEATSRGLECVLTSRREAHDAKPIKNTKVLNTISEDDNGILKVIDVSALANPNAKAPMKIINDSVIGDTSLAFQLNSGECGTDTGKWSDCANNRARIELDFEKEQAKQEKWYRFYLKFPDSHNNVAPSNLSIIQWKRYARPSQTMVQFQHSAAGLILNRNGQTYRNANIVLVEEKNLYNRWIEIVFNTNWHPDKEKGIMKVWIDGELKFDHKGASHAPNAEDLDLRLGLYSSFIHQYTNLFPEKVLPTRKVYIDGIRGSRTCNNLLNDSEKCKSLMRQTVDVYLIHDENKFSDKVGTWDLYDIRAEFFH